MMLFVRFPIRLSRALIFVLCIACAVFGVSLTLHSLIFLHAAELRPAYAVTWRTAVALATPAAFGGTGACVCGCVYPISQAGCEQVLFIGCVMTVQSLMLGFR